MLGCQYGSDKPDTRFEMKITDATDLLGALPLVCEDAALGLLFLSPSCHVMTWAFVCFPCTHTRVHTYTRAHAHAPLSLFQQRVWGSLDTTGDDTIRGVKAENAAVSCAALRCRVDRECLIVYSCFSVLHTVALVVVAYLRFVN